MIEIQIYDSTISTVRLERFEADDEDDAAATAELLAAVDDLARGWLEPLGIALRVECLDRANFMQVSPTHRPPQRHWFLRGAALPAEVEPNSPFSESKDVTEPRLDAAAIARCVANATTQPCGDLVPGLDEMWWTIVRARLPVTGELVTMDGPYPVRSRIEKVDGAQWAVGPTGGLGYPPMGLRASNDHGVTSISLSTHWSAWLDYPALVAEAVERVLARGRGWARAER